MRTLYGLCLEMRWAGWVGGRFASQIDDGPGWQTWANKTENPCLAVLYRTRHELLCRRLDGGSGWPGLEAQRASRRFQMGTASGGRLGTKSRR